MERRIASIVVCALGLALSLASLAPAQVDPLVSACAVTIAQFPPRAGCLASMPMVARLCPDVGAVPPFDVVSFGVTALTAAGVPVVGAPVTAVELGGPVNISVGGSTTAVTGPGGAAAISVTNASGWGLIGVCVGGVVLPCRVEVRSPDTARSGLPGGCGLPTTAPSFVAGADINNPICGFVANFGAVIPGVNSMWNLNCDANVNAADIVGLLGKGGVLQHFGHGEMLMLPNTCP